MSSINTIKLLCRNCFGPSALARRHGLPSLSGVAGFPAMLSKTLSAAALLVAIRHDSNLFLTSNHLAHVSE